MRACGMRMICIMFEVVGVRACTETVGEMIGKGGKAVGERIWASIGRFRHGNEVLEAVGDDFVAYMYVDGRCMVVAVDFSAFGM